MLEDQADLSPITGRVITDPVLDHDHQTGSVRAVLDRWENSVLGRLENWSRRIGNGQDPIVFLRACADYIERHKLHPLPLKYPTYRTEEEKRDKRNKKAKKTRDAKKASTSIVKERKK
jgi:hypothetical protein